MAKPGRYEQLLPLGGVFTFWQLASPQRTPGTAFHTHQPTSQPAVLSPVGESNQEGSAYRNGRWTRTAHEKDAQKKGPHLKVTTDSGQSLGVSTQLRQLTPPDRPSRALQSSAVARPTGSRDAPEVPIQLKLHGCVFCGGHPFF